MTLDNEKIKFTLPSHTRAAQTKGMLKCGHKWAARRPQRSLFHSFPTLIPDNPTVKIYDTAFNILPKD